MSMTTNSTYIYQVWQNFTIEVPSKIYFIGGGSVENGFVQAKPGTAQNKVSSHETNVNIHSNNRNFLRFGHNK